MIITSKSIQRSNITFVFKQDGFVPPENSVFAGLYSGEISKGSNFLDDPVMRVKVLNTSKLKMTFVLEGSRFRVDKDNEKELDLDLVSEAMRSREILFGQNKLESYGFNFDIIYRFENTIQMNYIFGLLFDSGKILAKKDLTNLGIQFNLQRPNNRNETYFIKIVSPLELAIHANYHFASDKLPEKDELEKLFQKSYEETDEVVQNLRF